MAHPVRIPLLLGLSDAILRERCHEDAVPGGSGEGERGRACVCRDDVRTSDVYSLAVQ